MYSKNLNFLTFYRLKYINPLEIPSRIRSRLSSIANISSGIRIIMTCKCAGKFLNHAASRLIMFLKFVSGVNGSHILRRAQSGFRSISAISGATGTQCRNL